MAFKIAYGAGHYLHEPGRRIPKELDPNETREWTLNDRVARYFAEAAKQYEDVELLRTDDPTGQVEVNLQPRCDKANAFGANVYLSIHHNAGANMTNAGGVTAYSYYGSENGAKYRDSIYEACIAAGGLRGNRAQPKQEAGFHVLKYTHMPAVLMEYGFMDSLLDAPVILQEAYSKKVGYATMEGIAKTAGLKKVSAPVPTPAPAPAPQPDQIGTTYRVQVGAFSKKAYAEKKKEVVKSAGFENAFLANVDGKLWRVHVGPYASKEEAVKMQTKLENAGFSGYVTALSGVAEKEEPAPAPSKSIDELAWEVIDCKHGNGEARRKSLGDQYDAVQKRVNELLK